MTARHSVSERAIRWLSVNRWYIFVALGVVAFALGCIGNWPRLEHPSIGGAAKASLRAAYDSLLLFPLPFSKPAIGEELSTPLIIARVLVYVGSSWAAIAIFAAAFPDKALKLRIPFIRGHVVVCGLGDAGNVFVHDLTKAGERVVVIEIDPTNPNIPLCRRLKIPLIIGDAQLEPNLQAAGLRRAARLLAVTSNDTTNTEIVAVATELADQWHGEVFDCLARITDPDLCMLLRIQSAKRTDGPGLDFFNTEEVAARLLLQDFPFDTASGLPHILVAHLDPLGAWLIVHAARQWYDQRTDDTIPLQVTVLDPRGSSSPEILVGQHPSLEKACRFTGLSTSNRDVHRLRPYHGGQGSPPISRAYVTANRDEHALQTALKLRHALDPDTPLVVALSRKEGVSHIIEDAWPTRHLLAGIDVFPTLRRTCTVGLIRGGSAEDFAQALHEHWRITETKAGRAAPAWAELDESRKQSSRAQARDISVKLRAIGCELAPLRDWDGMDFAFTDEEIQTLAIAEHERWCRERRADGWTAGDKNVDLKTTPYLVPFDEMPAEIAELDRMFVRSYPSILASAGLQVIRRRADSTPAPQTSPPPR